MADEKKDEAPKPKRDLGPMMFAIFAVLNLCVLGGGGFLVYKSTLGHHVESLSEEEILKDLKEKKVFSGEDPILLTFEPFTINLKDPKYVINTEVSVSLLDEDGFEELMSQSPKARDAIMRIFYNKDFQDLESLQGKLFLKEEMIIALNAFLKEGVVKDIFFHQFVVQSR